MTPTTWGVSWVESCVDVMHAPRTDSDEDIIGFVHEEIPIEALRALLVGVCDCRGIINDQEHILVDEKVFEVVKVEHQREVFEVVYGSDRFILEETLVFGERAAGGKHLAVTGDEDSSITFHGSVTEQYHGAVLLGFDRTRHIQEDELRPRVESGNDRRPDVRWRVKLAFGQSSCEFDDVVELCWVKS